MKGQDSTKDDAAKVGAASGIGAIIGAIAGGGKGAAIGAIIGGGAGTAGVMTQRGKDIRLERGQHLKIRTSTGHGRSVKSEHVDLETGRQGKVSPSLPVITLLTDFGTADYFVGAVKGAILSVNPSAVIVDITHEIPPQDIEAGAFTLLAAYKTFPVDDSCGGGRSGSWIDATADHCDKRAVLCWAR